MGLGKNFFMCFWHLLPCNIPRWYVLWSLMIASLLCLSVKAESYAWVSCCLHGTAFSLLFFVCLVFSLYCTVVVLVLCASLSSSLATFGLGRFSLRVSKSVLSLPLRADWPRSPLAHGCRSTHNSPVHSACSSQRLSQNFSVSVPTLIFTGTQKQGRKVL